MADRVALSVKASQDQQNNSVEHPETVSLLCLIVYFKLYKFSLNGARQSFWKKDAAFERECIYF